MFKHFRQVFDFLCVLRALCAFAVNNRGFQDDFLRGLCVLCGEYPGWQIYTDAMNKTLAATTPAAAAPLNATTYPVIAAISRIGNSTTFPEVFQHLPPIVNRNFPPGSSDLSWNPCLFP